MKILELFRKLQSKSNSKKATSQEEVLLFDTQIQEHAKPHTTVSHKVKKLTREQRKIENSDKHIANTSMNRPVKNKAITKQVKEKQLVITTQTNEKKKIIDYQVDIKQNNGAQNSLKVVNSRSSISQELQQQKSEQQKAEQQKIVQQKSVQEAEQALFIEWINTKGTNQQKDNDKKPKLRQTVTRVKQTTNQNMELETFKDFILKKYSKELKLNQIKWEQNILTRFKPFAPLFSLGIKVNDLHVFSEFKDMGTYLLIEIDVHGYLLNEFKQLLQQLFTINKKQVVELRCIHGYTQGTALRDYLRTGFQHNRLKSVKTFSSNDGRTDLILARE